jgi:hypothetical protein
MREPALNEIQAGAAIQGMDNSGPRGGDPRRACERGKSLKPQANFKLFGRHEVC